MFNAGDEGADSRTNPFEERGNDMNEQVDYNSAKDLLIIHGGSMTRAKAKRMKEALIYLLEGTWKEQAGQNLVKFLWIQEEPKIINVIQISPHREEKVQP